jgi:hypothetical protein
MLNKIKKDRKKRNKKLKRKNKDFIDSKKRQQKKLDLTWKNNKLSLK